VTITLRIKRRYFDEILAGTKTVEYRDAKPFYDKMLTRAGIKYLKLHYQQPRQLLCEVRGIIKQRTPDTDEFRGDPSMPFSEWMYCIMLGEAILI
jgi:hypothetical protein